MGRIYPVGYSLLIPGSLEMVAEPGVGMDIG